MGLNVNSEIALPKGKPPLLLRANWSGCVNVRIQNPPDKDMRPRIYDPRIIAIDLRLRRSGFAAFEGNRKLLDFGTIHLGQFEDGGSKFPDLLKMLLPSTIVVKRERWNNLVARSDSKSFIESLTMQAKAHSTKIRLLEQNTLDATFGCETKAEITASLALIFPELVWKLPPRRRIWEPEHSRQTVFDAIALGLAFWQSEMDLIDATKGPPEIQEGSI